jgi:hypothetical protein
MRALPVPKPASSFRRDSRASIFATETISDFMDAALPWLRHAIDSPDVRNARMPTPPIPFEHQPRLNRISCPRCGDMIVSPEWAVLSADGRPTHQWRCECGHEFLTAEAGRARAS